MQVLADGSAWGRLCTASQMCSAHTCSGLSLELLELLIDKFRNELCMPMYNKRWSVQTDASTSGSVHDISEKCSLRLMSKNPEEINEECNLIIIPVGYNFLCSVYNYL